MADYKPDEQDPYVARYRFLWGEEPPPGYVDSLIASGMNVKEMEAHERAKPAFSFSPTYREEMVAHKQSVIEAAHA